MENNNFRGLGTFYDDHYNIDGVLEFYRRPLRKKPKNGILGIFFRFLITNPHHRIVAGAGFRSKAQVQVQWQGVKLMPLS